MLRRRGGRRRRRRCQGRRRQRRGRLLAGGVELGLQTHMQGQLQLGILRLLPQPDGLQGGQVGRRRRIVGPGGSAGGAPQLSPSRARVRRGRGHRALRAGTGAEPALHLVVHHGDGSYLADVGAGEQSAVGQLERLALNFDRARGVVHVGRRGGLAAGETFLAQVDIFALEVVTHGLDGEEAAAVALIDDGRGGGHAVGRRSGIVA
mmetsp:Transcript_14925/g.33177  ORF Transcript_14925/g.33177 Transcript_14925/m.33177 type:complete len:206 (+) Transcript_14925:521-1138(+)